MRYDEVDSTYLAKAIARISGALETVSRIPVMINPPDEYRERATNSFWALGALLMTDVDNASDLSVQTWTVASYLIWEPKQDKYDATVYSAMYALVPKVYNYMQAHRRLCFTDDQNADALLYLQAGRVTVSLNSLNQNGQPGFTIVHRLPFQLNIDEEY